MPCYRRDCVHPASDRRRAGHYPAHLGAVWGNALLRRRGWLVRPLHHLPHTHLLDSGRYVAAGWLGSHAGLRRSREKLFTPIMPLFTKQRNGTGLRAGKVTAGLVESNGNLPLGLWLTSPAGGLPRTRISSPRTLHLVIEYGLTLPFLYCNDSRCHFCYSPNTHTHPFNGLFSGITQVSRYQKGKTNLDFTEARDSECQWHQLGHMQVCTSLLTR